MNTNQSQETVTKKVRNPVWDAFTYGFFSTVGMFVAVEVIRNRDRITASIRHAIQEAR